jgi:hypothetical protein
VPHSPSSSWKEPYLAALKEPDTEKLTELVHATEWAMFLRLQELARSADGHEERNEIRVASENLLTLETLTLGWPPPLPAEHTQLSNLFARRFNMVMKRNRRRATTSLYLIESREAERKLTEARNKKKALAAKTPKAQ